MADVIVNIQGVQAVGQVENLILRQRFSFALHPLLAAARFARDCGRVEQENTGKELGPFFDEIIQYSSASVIMAVISLEAYINDYLESIAPLFPNTPPTAMEKLDEWLAMLAILKKYDLALEVKKLPSLDKSSKNYQAVDILVKFRNALVHFKPSWNDELGKHHDLGKSLRGRFRFSPFITKNTGVIFPQRCFCHEGAAWAVTTAQSFMRDFDSRLGREHFFDSFEERLKTK